MSAGLPKSTAPLDSWLSSTAHHLLTCARLAAGTKRGSLLHR